MHYVAQPSFLFWIPVLIFGLPILLWIGFASTLARRDSVERPNRIAQWYGYSVCLVAVLTVLFSSVGVVESLFTLSSPLQGDDGYGPSLSSFEAYRATHLRTPFLAPAEQEELRRTPPTEQELRRQYDALRADRLERNRHDARRALVTSGLLTLFAAALFVFHWRWLRRLGAADERPAPAG